MRFSTRRAHSLCQQPLVHLVSHAISTHQRLPSRYRRWQTNPSNRILCMSQPAWTNLTTMTYTCCRSSVAIGTRSGPSDQTAQNLPWCALLLIRGQVCTTEMKKALEEHQACLSARIACRSAPPVGSLPAFCTLVSLSDRRCEHFDQVVQLSTKSEGLAYKAVTVRVELRLMRFVTSISLLACGAYELDSCAH